jgi:L-lysine exporter family protein LysE/ArgO
MIFTPLLKGFGMGASLIMAIGAQNAFVLKQGLKRHHLFLTAITCFICDSILIVLGVSGLGMVISDSPTLENVLRWGGATFLVAYAIRSFMSVFKPHALVAELDNPMKRNRLGTFLALLAFTLLNPHTYIDTFLILGGIGAQHPLDEQTHFIIGALVASFVWFFGLTYGASMLSHVFRNPRAWQILDTIMGFVMLSIAYSLVV